MNRACHSFFTTLHKHASSLQPKKDTPKRLKRFSFTVLALSMTLLIINNSCRPDRSKQVASDKAQEQTKVKIHIDRLEKDLFAVSPDSVPQAIPGLKAKYGEFFDIFNYVLKLGHWDTPKYPESLKKFVTDYFENLSYNKVIQVYPNIDDITRDFEDAFTTYKTYFPNKRVPRIFTWISGWNQPVVTSDTIMGIGLDMYLGRNCEFYYNLQLPQYIHYTYERKYIVPDCMKMWGKAEFDFKDSATDMISKMLYEAKIQYFVKKILPNTPDSLLYGFSPSQLAWCVNNKKEMWTYLVEHKMFFTTDLMTIRKLTDPAPFTIYFTKESPGRAAVWLGQKIVDAYMKNNPNVSLAQLMQDGDYQKILRKSNFKP